MPSTEGAEGRLEGDAGKEIGWERRTSRGEHGFGRHLVRESEHEVDSREL